MKSSRDTKPLEWFSEQAENIRPVPVDDAIKELAYSFISNGILQPVGALDFGDHGELMYGFRRLAAYKWGVSENLGMPFEIPVTLYPPTTTPESRLTIQLIENVQREDLSDAQLYKAVVALENRGMGLAEIASVVGKSKPTVCRWFAPSHCVPEARQYFLAGRLTLGQAYKLSQAADQLAMLKVFLDGGTHEQAERSAKKGETEGGEGGKETVARVVIPLAVKTDSVTAFGKVTVASKPGEAIDLGGVETLLKEALRSVKDAIKQNLAVKSAQSAWKDMAAATSA